jgi:hypothetical protein
MAWMQWMQWLIPILSAILSAGGVWTLLSARATARATEKAALAAAQPATQAAVTADWTSLMAYWQAEMTALRVAATKLDVRVEYLERLREADLSYIDDLEQHIWSGLPPPPPPRRRVTTTTTTTTEGPGE